jgi:hypothetical protein
VPKQRLEEADVLCDVTCGEARFGVAEEGNDRRPRPRAGRAEGRGMQASDRVL